MCSQEKVPIMQPKITPKTEKAVATRANNHARDGFIRTIGISITSGGIGKKDASMKDTAPNKNIACGCPASAIVLLYRFLIIEVLSFT